MITCSEHITISKDLKKTYEVAERYPEFIDFYKKKEIIHMDETHSEVKIESLFCGLKFSWEGNGIKDKYHKITWVQSKGLLKGMKAEWFFCDLPGKTQVTLNVTFCSVLPLWEHIAAFLFIRKTLPRILSCLKVACERS